MPEQVLLRPVEAGDEDFLRRLYADTRAAEVASFGWDAASAAAFLHMQFDARQRHYLTAYPQGRFDIVELAGMPVGRLSVARTADAIRVVDIALLAQHQGRGIGTGLLQSLLDEGARRRRRVALQVEQHNRAAVLYRRLGFLETGHHGPYRLMEWRDTHAQASAQEQT